MRSILGVMPVVPDGKALLPALVVGVLVSRTHRSFLVYNVAGGSKQRKSAVVDEPDVDEDVEEPYRPSDDEDQGDEDRAQVANADAPDAKPLTQARRFDVREQGRAVLEAVVWDTHERLTSACH